jgi:NADH dehydrogenase FAD-containing subunit
VRVDDFLQAEPSIYVIGDNADTAYSGMAQTAIYDGRFVARNLIRLADKKSPKPYSPKRPIYVIPAGPRWAAVLWGVFRMYAIWGWLLRRTADWIAFHDFVPWTIATSHWLAEYDNEEYCPYCVDDTVRVAELT